MSHHPFLLYFLFLSICSFHIPSTNLHWRNQKAPSIVRQLVCGETGSINTGMAEELHAFLQSPLPGLTSLALQSAHLPSPQRGESMPVPICSPHYTDRRGVGHEHVFMKENCIFLKHFLEFFQTLFIQMKFGAFSNPFFKQPQSITVEHVGLSLQLLRKWHLKGLTHMNPSVKNPTASSIQNSTYNLAIVPITVTS